MPKSRLLLNYNKTCPTCSKVFYSKSLAIKYCCQDCANTAHRIQQRIASAKWRKKQKKR